MATVAAPLGVEGGAGLAHLVAAGVGVLGLIKAVTLEPALYGVVMYAIAPGPAEAPFTSGELSLGRFGRVDEVARTALLPAGSPDGDLYAGTDLGTNCGDVMP